MIKGKIIFLVYLMISVFPLSAYDFIKDGIAYNILEDGTLSVTHKQPEGWEMPDIDQSLSYTGNIEIPAFVIHEGKKYKVSKIGAYAFYDCKSLESVKIPEGIENLGFFAISYNDNITSLHIPSSVLKLTPGFLYRCPNLSELTVSPDNKNYISEGNVIYNKDMTQVILVSPKLRVYEFPPTVKSVVDYAFNFSSIKRLIIPETLTHIGGRSFVTTMIGDIVCNKKLEHLPGSRKWSRTGDLPLWATGWGIPFSVYRHRE